MPSVDTNETLGEDSRKENRGVETRAPAASNGPSRLLTSLTVIGGALAMVPTVTAHEGSVHASTPHWALLGVAVVGLGILGVAISAGYYDIPRTATQRDLATELDLSRGTVGEYLRRAESKIIRSVLISE